MYIKKMCLTNYQDALTKLIIENTNITAETGMK